MAVQATSHEEQGNGVTGFATLDDCGRLALSKAARQALDLRSGSPVAYVVVDGAIMLIPQDEHLARLSEHAARVLADAGLSVQDLIDELPAAREQIMREEYGDEFVDALEREHAALRGTARDAQV